jgi:hypothetical protein
LRDAEEIGELSSVNDCKKETMLKKKKKKGRKEKIRKEDVTE